MTLQSDFSLLQSGCAGLWFSSLSLLLARGPVLWVCLSQGRPSRRRGVWASARSSVCWSLRSAFSGTAILIGCSDSADTAAGAEVVQVLRQLALLLFSGYFGAARKRLRRFETDLNSSQPPEYQAHRASASSPSLCLVLGLSLALSRALSLALSRSSPLSTPDKVGLRLRYHTLLFCSQRSLIRIPCCSERAVAAE